IVFRIAVQLKFTDFNQWIIAFRPDFGQVKWMIRHCFSFEFRHDLNVHFPFWIVTTFDGIKQVGLAAFTVFGNQVCSFSIGQVLNTLLGTHMEFYPEAFILSINKPESMPAKTMHMTVTGRDPTIRHDNSYLMQSFR